MIVDDTLESAIAEAERFLNCARTYQQVAALAPKNRQALMGRWSAAAEHAAVKRASLDLTRKLADLRQNR